MLNNPLAKDQLPASSSQGETIFQIAIRQLSNYQFRKKLCLFEVLKYLGLSYVGNMTVSCGVRTGDAMNVSSFTTVHPAMLLPLLLRGFELIVYHEPTSPAHTDPSQPPGRQIDSWGLGVSVSKKGLPQPVNTHTPMDVGPVSGENQRAHQRRETVQQVWTD